MNFEEDFLGGCVKYLHVLVCGGCTWFLSSREAAPGLVKAYSQYLSLLKKIKKTCGISAKLL